MPAYNAATAWRALGSAGLDGFDAALAWGSLIDSAQPYPSGVFHAPLRPPRQADKARALGALHWQYDGPEVLTARPTALAWACGPDVGALELDDDDTAAAAQFATLLARPSWKGRQLAAWGAADAGFHAFLRHLARPLVALGFTIEPIATGTRCKALIIRKGRRAWWLTDVQEQIGGGSLAEAAFVAEYAPRVALEEGSAEALQLALGAFQRSMLGLFGVGLRATIGAAALRAASRHVPRQGWVWRPDPLLVALLRTGRGMRGGYATARRYDGPAWRADLSKAYTAALAGPLPLRAALVGPRALTPGAPGVFLCRVRGPGTLPLYLAPWSRGGDPWQPDYWQGRECLAVMVTPEVAAAERLGYTVEPLGGFRFVRQWTLAPFVQLVAAAAAKHGRGSAHERTAKIVGNAVYGKLAERPEHEEVMYAAARPGDGWHPMIGLDGAEVPDLWVRAVVSHRPGQHVDIAATVTARVRGWLLDGCAATLEAGGRVVHADTDGMLTTIDPTPLLRTGADAPGVWRVDEGPQRAIVWGRKGYAFGDEVKAAGFAGLDVHDAARIAAGERVQTVYMQRGAPWTGRAPLLPSTRRARATTA